ncbi:condensation domain-containing protein, partial [Brevibacillus sp. SYSU BS000544]|uniref:condensation domain-containing protein n=1 Tax=Brevibacillus sp. SYSU BS000544 TaxID=3416443 RepID=UPI003CE44B1A
GEPTKAVWKDMTTRTITLSQEATTKLLKETNRAYNTEINDILLSALGLAVKEWCGAEKIAIALEGHGREEIVDGVDTTRTVGWFTSCYPVILNMKDREIGMVIKRTKEYLRKVPNKGIGYGMLTQLTDRNSADLKIKADISFNYLGQFDQDMTDERITYSHLSTGNNASPDLPAWNSIQINSMIKHNQLCIMVDFHEKEFKEQTMDHFMAIYEEMLQKTIQHCAGKQETEQTPSDYGVNDYTLEDLEEIKAYVSEHIGENAVAAKINKLTPMQEGMLFTYLQEKDTTAYVLQSEFKVKGNIQLQLLNQAYQALCEKHLILNTIILDHWKHPAQIVIANREAAVEYEDFSQEADQEEAYQRYSKQIVTKGFELSRDRLFKLHLVRLKEEEYRLVVSCHHIIIDGWSNTFVRNDLFQLYEALANQEISPIRAEYDYEKYIQWLETQDRDEGLFYWKKHLEDYCEEIILPARKIEAPGYKEGLLEIELGNDMSNRLLQISKQCGVTLNTLCQTAWAILLQKYSNTSDVVFGAVVSGRPAAIAEVESMVGMFINTIPIRIKSEADQPIKELLAKAQAANNAAMPYEYLPLAEFQKLTALKQNLFQTLMVFENYPEQQASDRKPVFTAERIKGREQTSYDLNIVFMFEDKLSFALMYNQNVYEESFIGKFGKQLQYIFEKIAKQPEERIADIELVDQDEQHLILNRFNDTIRAYPRYKTINEIFEETAGRAGDKAAVVSSGVALGYRDLNERANQLARLLRKKGITRDSIASILCDKSVETIVAMLAVIKAGGAYLPIDKDYPEARIRYMLEDSRSTVLLGKQIWTTRLNLEGIRAELIDLDGEAASIESKENLELINQPEDLAYVIYTSGTTGNPKGVCITHRSVIKNAKNTNYIDVQEDDRFLQAGSLSFDAAVLPTWIALLIGIPLHMEDDEITMNFHSLEQYMLENRITLTVLPTTLFNQLSQERIEAFQNIRYVIAGGDIISSKQVSRLVKKYKDITVVNGYGPTENTVISTAYMIAGEWDED